MALYKPGTLEEVKSMEVPTVEDIMKGEMNSYLATAEGNQPRVRPVTLVKNEDAFYVITGSEDAKTKQIHNNGKVEVVVPVTHEGRTGYIRFSAQATIVSDSAIRTRVATATSYFSNYFKSPDDPKYALLHLVPTKAEYLKPNKMYPDPIDL
jgi:uncharacterized pyridoxamine 5'-phosphate oxidase family protein